VLNAFVDISMAGLSRSEIAVWMVLYRDTRDGIAQTSQVAIARRAGVEDRTVRRAINRLTARGLVTVVYHGGLNRGPSKYRVRGAPTNGELLRTPVT
jgi:DNA-binding MarR family transcriptional regulator